MNRVERSPIPQPVTYNESICAYSKKWGPAWIYKIAVAGVAVGEYGLKRWDITVGFAGCGLLAMYAFCYFFANKEITVTPQAVKDYEDQNQKNIGDLEEVQSEISEIGKDFDRTLLEMEEARKKISVSSKLVTGNNSDLALLNQEEEEEKSALDAANQEEVLLTSRLQDQKNLESRAIADLNADNASLQTTLVGARAFLNARKGEK